MASGAAASRCQFFCVFRKLSLNLSPFCRDEDTHPPRTTIAHCTHIRSSRGGERATPEEPLRAQWEIDMKKMTAFASMVATLLCLYLPASPAHALAHRTLG